MVGGGREVGIDVSGFAQIDRRENLRPVATLNPTTTLVAPSHAAGTTLPGLKMPLGSSAVLIARMTSTPAPCSRRMYFILP